MKEYYVYLHKIENGDVFYVGQGKRYRYKQTKRRSKRWQSIYNNNKCKVIIYKQNLTLEESLLLEKELIKKYGRIDNNTGTLVNHNDGGIGLKGKDNYFYNKSLFGEKNGNYGNKYEKNPLSKPIYKLDLFGNIIKEYTSAKEAQDKDNYFASSITACCNNKRKIHKGFQFIFKNNYISKEHHIYSPSKTEKKPIVALKVENGIYKIYKYYNQLKEVTIDGFSKSSVEKKLNQYDKFHKGYCFFYIEKLPDNIKKEIQDKYK